MLALFFCLQQLLGAFGSFIIWFASWWKLPIWQFWPALAISFFFHGCTLTRGDGFQDLSASFGTGVNFPSLPVSVLKLEGAAVLSTTLGRVLTDLTAFKVSLRGWRPAGPSICTYLFLFQISVLISSACCSFFWAVCLWALVYDTKRLWQFPKLRESRKKSGRSVWSRKKSCTGSDASHWSRARRSRCRSWNRRNLDDEDLIDTAVGLWEDYGEPGVWPHEPLDLVAKSTDEVTPT